MYDFLFFWKETELVPNSGRGEILRLVHQRLDLLDVHILFRGFGDLGDSGIKLREPGCFLVVGHRDPEYREQTLGPEYGDYSIVP